MEKSRAARRGTSPITLGLLLGLLSATVSSEANSETYLKATYGPGGSPFSDRCPTGQVLHGFEMRAADDVDAIRPICFLPSGPGDTVGAPLSASDWRGGPAGRLERLVCPGNKGIGAVVGMRVISQGRTTVVNEIQLFCGPVSADPFQLGEPSAIFKAPEHRGGYFIGVDDETQRCPDGEVAVGLHGRTGIWVDAIGLICDSPGRDRGFAELKRRPPPVPLGRKHPTSPAPDPFERKGVPLGTGVAPPPICVAASNARGRNSPAAPSLERQCQIALEQIAARARSAPPPPPVVASPAPVPPPPVNYPPPVGYPPPSGSYPGPITSTPGSPGSPGSWRPSPICEAARRARDENSPGADRLEALCRGGNDVWGVPGTRSPLTYREQSEVLDVHNRLRPDVVRLQWDVALEDSAARWAAQLAASGRMANDPNIRGALGENMFIAVPGGRYTFADVSRIWASERAGFRPGIFPDVTGYGSSAVVTNYTQMIWPGTTHVGCAVQRSPSADVFVCRYAPAGNVYGTALR